MSLSSQNHSHSTMNAILHGLKEAYMLGHMGSPRPEGPELPHTSQTHHDSLIK